MTYPGKMTREEAEAMGLVEPLDLRSTEEIEAETEERSAALREVLTGLPARPGVIR